nr:helix-turn-helix domain-containing protein [Anaerosolibacter carboniphilus]
MLNYPWPGNVRELENIVERIIVISEEPIIELSDLPEYIRTGIDNGKTNSLDVHKDEVEERIIRNAILESQGNMTRAAEKLGISRRSLYRKIHKYGIDDNRMV